MKFSVFSAIIVFSLAGVGFVNAEIVSVTTTGTITLSEISNFAEEDQVTGSFSYDSSSEGEVFTTDDGTLTETKYTGISASFRNSSGTLAVETTEATIIITQVKAGSIFRNPRHELRLSFPKADIPAAGTNQYQAFIGFFSFTDQSLTAFKDGKLPETIDEHAFQSMWFLFAWNRKPGDEAPLEYGGQLEVSQEETIEPIDLQIRPGGELEFSTKLGLYYQIEYSDDLQNWLPLRDPIEGDGRLVSRIVSAAGVLARNFRVRTIRNGDDQ